MVDTFNNEIISSALSRTTGDPKPYYKCLEDLLALLKDNKKTAPRFFTQIKELSTTLKLSLKRMKIIT
ncbi:hypothetical protein [Erysipelothrix piscisicarius]|uniref:hypothetical protein n=1 Tax=Erysipelothrix piscisicarius TaxID=2485784 RepID=UPI001E5E58DD|nr:hypothetical protein [Erysipelothrix piscisicarius]